MSEQEKAKDWASTVVGGQSYACRKGPSADKTRELPNRDSALLPCPFCGAPAEFGDRSESRFWAVHCSDLMCDVAPHTGWKRSPEHAIHLWNRRPNAADVGRAGDAGKQQSQP